jgi:cytochrome c556
MQRVKATYGASVMIVTSILTSMVVTRTHAQQSGTQPTGSALPPKALVPVAASTLTAHPDGYYGEYVSLTAPVKQSLSKLAFVVHQDTAKNTGNEVLVLVRLLNRSLDPDTYVTIVGEVVRFEPAEIASKAKDYVLDLAPDIMAKYRGTPAILASSVTTAAGVDATLRLPPPMTEAEEAYAKIMKQVGPANAALRKAIEANDSNVARESATVLKHAFAQTAEFWKKKDRADATTWAQDARKLADSIDRSAAGGKWEEVKAATGRLGQSCQTCHTAYRERFDDGSFRIKLSKTG